MYEQDFSRIIEASQKKALTFFVGAGVSKLSNTPSWKDLIDSICDELNFPKKQVYSSDDLLKIPQIFYYSINRNDEKYYNFISNKINSSLPRPNIIHKEMISLNPVSLITTNWDSLLEDSAIKYCQNYKTIACDEEVPNINGERFILKIHGDLNHRNIVFKEEDYLNYSENFKLIETILKSIFSTNTVVFVGYSLNDYNIKLILNWAKSLLKDNFNKPIFIYTDTEVLSSEELLYQESKGLSVLDYHNIASTSENYENRYSSIFTAIKESLNSEIDELNDNDCFEILYQRLYPLNELSAIRISDINDKLSPYVFVNDSGTIVLKKKGSHFFNEFIRLSELASDDFEKENAAVIEKYSIIEEIFKKARIYYIDSEFLPKKLIKEQLYLGNYNCINFEYLAMQAFTSKKYSDIKLNFLKGYYLARSYKYEESFDLFSKVASDAFKAGNYLFYYFAKTNCIVLHKLLDNLKLYGNSFNVDDDTFSIYENFDKLFESLPIGFQNTFSSLSNIHSVNLLYKYSYESMINGIKLQNVIDSNTIEFNLTSTEKIVYKINDFLNFILGNGLLLDCFSEYRNTVKYSMSLLLYKYCSQDKNIISPTLFIPFKNRLESTKEIFFDEIDFYCFIEYFDSKEIRNLFQKYNINTIEFSHIEIIENNIINITKYYKLCCKKNYSIAKKHLCSMIKSCLMLMRYMDISQALIDYFCKFIFSYNFDNIYIDDKIMFLDYQIVRKNKYSENTKKVIKKIFYEYLDNNIIALKSKNSFEILSANSRINYCDLINYIDPKNQNYYSRKLSIRISEIIKNDLFKLLPDITNCYWRYLSKHQKKCIVTWIEKKLSDDFSFKTFSCLINYNVQVKKELLQKLIHYLKTKYNTNNISKDSADDENNNELVQVGYWCLIKLLNHNDFIDFVGINDHFDFYYLYSNFNFDKFKISWLMNLYPHTYKAISDDPKVKQKIRIIICKELKENKISNCEREALIDVLLDYFV